MIVENRRITFSPDAIREAVKLYRMVNPSKQPPGDLGPIFIRGSSPVHLGVSVRAVGSSVFREVEMVESEVAVMLILLCRKLKIPIPRTGAKGIEVQGDSIMLVISKAMAVEPVTGI